MRTNSECGLRLTWGAMLLAVAWLGGCREEGSSQSSRADGRTTGTTQAQGQAAMEARIKHLEALSPGQGTLMTEVAYHFGSLWFALDHGNWPLADFYLHECRESIEQAVEAMPVRKLSTGVELNIRGIAEALDNTQFVELASAIAAKQRDRAVAAYRDTIIVCQSCHQAAEKPFLRVQIPDRPPSPSIDFKPFQPD